MYAHQVIEDLKILKKVNILNDDLFDQGVDLLQGLIKDSQHFHLGAYQDFIKPLGNVINKETRIFSEGCGENIRLPYKKCWFEFENKVEGVPLEEDVPKRGMFVQEMGEDLLWVWIVNWPKIMKKWFVSPQNYFVVVGKTIGEHEMMRGMATQVLKSKGAPSSVIESCYKTNVWPQPFAKFVDGGNSLELMKDDHRDLVALNAALMLLNCKNVVTENKIPSIKLNKRRRKAKKTELFTYKTLSLLLPTESKTGQKEYIKTGFKTKLHLCRGHFKNYTKEAPLFGKHTGLYWWDPQIKGNKKEGLVVKEYDIKTKN